MATPGRHPPQGGRLGALAGPESASRLLCSQGSQAGLEVAYGCFVPSFVACVPAVQQHDHGKDHRGTLPAEGRARGGVGSTAEESPQA